MYNQTNTECLFKQAVEEWTLTVAQWAHYPILLANFSKSPNSNDGRTLMAQLQHISEHLDGQNSFCALATKIWHTVTFSSQYH